MSIPAGNGAPGASGTGLALGYTLNIFWFNILFMLISENNMNTSTYFVHTLSLFYVMKLLVTFRIIIYRKLPSSLIVSGRQNQSHTPFHQIFWSDKWSIRKRYDRSNLDEKWFHLFQLLLYRLVTV